MLSKSQAAWRTKMPKLTLPRKREGWIHLTWLRMGYASSKFRCACLPLLRLDTWIDAARNCNSLRYLSKHCMQVSVPKQDNCWDCGLFMVSYMDFFAYTLPRQIHVVSAGRRKKLLIDFEGMREPTVWKSQLDYVPGLEKQWITTACASTSVCSVC